MQEKPGIFKRLFSILYDSFLILASMIILAFVWRFIATKLGLAESKLILDIGYNVIIFGLLFFFYQFFWLRGGQTLGMTAWRLRLVKKDGSKLRLRDTALRWLLAGLSLLLFGLGYLWCIVDREKRTLHDIYGNTKIVVLPKVKK